MCKKKKVGNGANRSDLKRKIYINAGADNKCFGISNSIGNTKKTQCFKHNSPLHKPPGAHQPFCFTGWRLVCDECAAPLHLYGENFIETYCNGRANILKCLCDLHAAELLEVEK